MFSGVSGSWRTWFSRGQRGTPHPLPPGERTGFPCQARARLRGSQVEPGLASRPLRLGPTSQRRRKLGRLVKGD